MSWKWLAIGAAGIWGFARYQNARRRGVPLGVAFAPGNLFKPVDQVDNEAIQAQLLDLQRAWKQRFPTTPFPGVVAAYARLQAVPAK